ncbi:DUF1559 domain-containing protein [Maioricimonas sp. JC845]|uniref:DUF1559 family PulG-like putative transporter n=1 Tax=Maioricimonas sp. JC845 TaxID=3232138 RepID=UPI003457E359
MNARPTSRTGFTLAELLVSLGIVGLLVSLLLPGIQNSRAQARQAQCANNLRGLAAAAMNYESVHGGLPRTSSSGGDDGISDSPHRHLMAFLDESVARQIDFDDHTPPLTNPDARIIMNSPDNERLRERQLPFLVCPSDDAPPGSTNYRANVGASVQVLRFRPPGSGEELAQSGAFVFGRQVSLAEFRDGQSNTALFSERVVGDRQADRYTPFRDLFAPPGPIFITTDAALHACRSLASSDPPATYSWMGTSWLIGGHLHTWYNHVAGPNSRIPDCANGGGRLINDGGRGIFSARSLHAGGVNVAFADGAVRFVSQQIDLSVWRSLGTRAAGD